MTAFYFTSRSIRYAAFSFVFSFGLNVSADAQTTASEQKRLAPKEVLDQLMEGNKRYAAGELTEREIKQEIQTTATGQYPKAVILSCLDSRVPVEWIFDQGIGDLFVGRVAGNIENEDQLGSMEFATKLAGAKLVMVLGHTACGAVKGACDDAELGHLTGLLKKIQPAVEAVEGFEDERTSKNLEFVNAVVEQNAKMTAADIRDRSDVLRDLEKSGGILIVGAVYDLETGKVTLLE